MINIPTPPSPRIAGSPTQIPKTQIPKTQIPKTRQKRIAQWQIDGVP